MGEVVNAWNTCDHAGLCESDMACYAHCWLVQRVQPQLAEQARGRKFPGQL